MMENITTTYPKANKDHVCEGHIQILDHDPDNETKHKCKGIKKGDEYIKQVNKLDDIYTWKSCLPCYDVIADNGFYNE